ncbi:MAG TPA: 1-deoxy-D-xylulose-5-phosphate reductoisomerase, partial [Pedococcus sp.]|nr:1-deoxy-D-xylulose-5-phosphate reductoisomerase [Pedococcus sp.]
MSSPRTVAVLGSTGSIGTQALEVISRNPERFRVVALSAGSNLDLVAEQAVAFGVDLVAVASGTSEAVAEAIGAYAARAGEQ